jgi:hypothetical protein
VVTSVEAVEIAELRALSHDRGQRAPSDPCRAC